MASPDRHAIARVTAARRTRLPVEALTPGTNLIPSARRNGQAM